MSAGDAAAPAITIVGGGWAGLSCALELLEHGHRARVHEASPLWGGRARDARVVLDGVELKLDNGQHLLIGAYHDALALIARIHPQGSAAFSRHRLDLRGPDGFRLRRWPLPGPLGLAAGLLVATGLNTRDKWAIVRMMWSLRARQWQPGPHTATVAELLGALAQPRRVITRLWEPLCVGALNTGIEQACARSFAAIVRDSLGAAPADSDFLVPRQTLGELFAEPAIAALTRGGADLRAASPVRAIARDEHGWRVSPHRPETPAGERTAHLVIATDAQAACRLLEPLAPRTSDTLRRLGTASIATVYLGWRDPVVLPESVLLDEDRDQAAPGQWLFDRGSQAGLRIAAVVISASERLASIDSKQLAASVAAQVCRQLRLPACVDASAINEKRATWRCTPGRARLASDSASAEGGPALSGLWLAGDYLDADYPATLESAVRSGRRLGSYLARLVGS